MTIEPEDADDKLLDDLLEGRAAADDDEGRRRAPYERLVQRLKEMPAPGWEQRVDAGVARELDAQRSRRALAIGAGVAVVVLAAAVLVLWLRPRSTARPPSVAMRVEEPGGTVRRGDAAAGDTLRLSVPATTPGVTLRVYRASRRVLTCPGDAACAAHDGLLSASLVLETGTYQIVYAVADAPLPAAGDASTPMDTDVRVLRNAGAHLSLPDPVVVSP